MTDRRYSDEEVAAIFAKAIEAEAPTVEQVTREGGLTLADVQDIGRQVGIPAEVLAKAAQSVEVGVPTTARTVLGFPISVERTIALNRQLTDAEWELLVVRLREAFDARGRLSAYGSFRQWTNGNLQALLEPTKTGHRLRLRTTKSSAQVGVRVGSFMLGMSGITAIAGAAAGHFVNSLPGVAMLFVAGVGMLVSGLLPLKEWAQTRSRQMDAIADELAER